MTVILSVKKDDDIVFTRG